MALRLLLLTPEFYGAEKIIRSVLEESDYEVTCIENREFRFDYHGTKAKVRFLRRLYFLLFRPDKAYIKKQFGNIENQRFDILLSINAHIICPFLLETLKKSNPSIHSFLYLWDSSEKYDWEKELGLFDKVYTFDKADSLKYNIEYKPNFYIRQEYGADETYESDIFFAGKFSPERLSIIDLLLEKSDASGFRTRIILWPAYKNLLHFQLLYLLFKKLKTRNVWIQNYIINYEAVEGLLDKEYITNKFIDYSDLQLYAGNSNVILDIPYEGQTGYTHRVIEALARGQKVLTTNSEIRNEVFFNPDQIHIYNAKNPVFDAGWIQAKGVFGINDFIKDLELKNWLKQVINVGAV